MTFIGLKTETVTEKPIEKPVEAPAETAEEQPSTTKGGGKK